jgi:NAD(P)-dependent dehydrogenase (short-subunit alcohol dehydrogenase family)
MKAPLIVLGATGTVGTGVVDAALAAGRPVVAVARRVDRLQALATRHAAADLVTVPGSVADDDAAQALAAELARLGRPPAGVVASLAGTPRRGSLLDQRADVLARALAEDVTSHLAAARQLLPLLANGDRGGSYVLVGGPGSGHPWAGYGHRSVTAAALRMLASVLHDEARRFGVRLQLLSIDTPLCTDCNRRHAGPTWPGALAIGARVLDLIDRRGEVAPVVRCADAMPASRQPDSPARDEARHRPHPAAPPPTLDGDLGRVLDALLQPHSNQETSPS